MEQRKTSKGTTYYVFSIEELTEADSNSTGFCIACGEESDTVEPDAEMYECDCCGKRRVYGAAQLMLMGYSI